VSFAALPLCRFAALPLCRFAALPLCRFAALATLVSCASSFSIIDQAAQLQPRITEAGYEVEERSLSLHWSNELAAVRE